MATRRGPTNQERLGVNATTLSATGTILSAPAFIYSVTVALNDTNSTGDAVLADASASAAADITANDFLGVRLGAGGISAGDNTMYTQTYNPPVYVGLGLVLSATNCECSVSYLDAS